jgi:protein-disulfide isomerase
VTVVSYSDFLCGYCARGSRTVDALVRKYPGRVRHLTKHAPMSEHGEYAARLYEALGLQQGELALGIRPAGLCRQAAIAAAPQLRRPFWRWRWPCPGWTPRA